MTTLFGKRPKIEKPKVVRMPNQNDPEILAAGDRAKRAARSRTGRQSTILTDALRGITGSSGQSLGN